MMNPELEAYIENHIEPEPDNLRLLERATNLQRVNGRMCSGHIQGRLLKMITTMINPARALEMGTFTGYSALCIAEGLGEEASLTTIEIDDELEEPILKAFSESEAGKKIKLEIGDALEVSRRYPDESFQMIFIDADKKAYPQYYAEAKRLLAPGGYILADNTLWDSHVVEKDPKDRQTRGVVEFNRLAAEDPDVDVAMIPVRDGISLIRKKGNQTK